MTQQLRIPALVAISAMAALAACGGGDWEDGEYEITASYDIQVGHPALEMGDSARIKLVQYQQGTADSPLFYADVRSVFCDEKICKVDVVRLFFDELGEYQRHTLQRGVDLEKAEGEPFTAADYEKLDGILANRGSGLGRTHIGEFYSHQGGESNVDAISGATISLHVDDYVEGASLTCYTLWHWANGDIYSFIRALTGDRRSIDDLRNYLANGAARYKVFALEQLMRRQSFEPKTTTLIVELSATSLSEYPDLIIDYLEQLPGPEYFAAMAKLFETGEKGLRLRSLYSLLASTESAPAGFYERLARRIPSLSSYQAIDLLLNVFDNKGVSAPAINENAAALLDHDDFIVARRAFWFLKNRQVSESDHDRLEAFYQKHAQAL